MTSKDEIQHLLRFLSQDAKVPLPVAMSKVKDLQNANLTSPGALSKTSITAVQTIFEDPKQAKTVLTAAKRVTKKRTAGNTTASSPAKRFQANPLIGSELVPAAYEESLTLPTSLADEDALRTTNLHTNRAPLVLAFAVKLLEFTMPSQPLSSRLSLAQAVVSVNSRSKAVNIGLVEKGTGAEDEGWGAGQPGVRILGREIKVMRRHGYDPNEGSAVKPEEQDMKVGEEKSFVSQSTVKQEDQRENDEPALWGLDLEALRSGKTPLAASTQRADGSGLPIYSAQHARGYILKAFVTTDSDLSTQQSPSKKPSASTQKQEKEENLARLLCALDLLYQSWAHVLSKDELDKRAWSWYVAVRPDVENGVAGWGGKGEVSLQKILDLRRKG